MHFNFAHLTFQFDFWYLFAGTYCEIKSSIFFILIKSQKKQFEEEYENAVWMIYSSGYS